MVTAQSSPSMLSDPNFYIRTSRLILLPTPLAIKCLAYRELYSSLHRNPEFTSMAFGASWGIKDWDVDSIVFIISREVQNSWWKRGMGDFAIGLRDDMSDLPKTKETGEGLWQEVEVDDVEAFDHVYWIGYVGLRDATTTSMPNEETSVPSERDWKEMIELRYGFHPDFWGKGYGTEAARAVMRWGETSRGAERFIAETEKANVGSGKVLSKLGFSGVGDEIIWGMEGTKEWKRWAGK
ncbi:hypothetical protein AUEXF2481DRAFT_33755 [Aureobasidium subglaciale EXF-2481]|uniref:N-acetyltransferase domain-containing protein n=1 Tax=Aureobasidium subglaciale (strain EXF-2481) TaxID=1043005 RepID=A0A074Y918_AURSE|nr:uncharacterized protein AUEXF2481DRAFT_33755 [Aureobasidium subglaciale EXF-2481]KEQ90667.1 hypothetical protein AUEXF2481DRAFT_33755 [Aureobasidium subglaciale EXF-2481]